MTFNMMRVKD